MEDERFISLEQSVVRVLILLYCAGEHVAEPGFTRRIDSNVKLQKLDFLLRNPDYLREMLLADAREMERLADKAGIKLMVNYWNAWVAPSHELFHRVKAGEIGPVGGKNFVHGYTASAALFCDV